MNDTRTLSEEDRAILVTKITELNNLKTEYGQHCLSFDEVQAQYVTLKQQHDDNLSSLKSKITSSHSEFQEITKNLLSKYGIDPQTGPWSLDLSKGSFVRPESPPIALPPKSKARVSARKPSKAAP